MKPDEALKVLELATAKLSANRSEHLTIIEAIQTLAKSLEQLKQSEKVQ